ncbi:unnamed protein product [Caenorhabditis auriculariae]|uniref:Major facilitator superfamily (MFS) profile domain-containing protein n=1 Tax=Caenorhabditis auriculariae TaxID=2777116 RepID=A0A8S1H796_9PELO|nr:unnamed protein product [Caenorhabditis auriculariae]
MQLRYFIYVLATACLTLIYAPRLAFHTTMICEKNENSSLEYLTDKDLLALTKQSVAYGLLLAFIPFTAAHVLGTRIVVTISGFVAASACAAYPFVQSYGYFLPVFLLRAIQGAPLVTLLWVIARVSHEWAPKKEIGHSIALLSSVYQLAPLLAPWLSSVMCSWGDWRYTYYVLAVACFLVHLLFFMFYTDDVSKNRFIKTEEVEKITQGKASGDDEKLGNIPYVAILKDVTVWALWIVTLGYFLAILTFLQWGSLYITQALGFPVQTAGASQALTQILCLILKCVLANRLDASSTDASKKLKVAFIVVEAPALAFLAIAYYSSNEILKLVSISLFTAVHGIAVVVVIKTQVLRAGKYSHILANGNTATVVASLFVLPIIVKYLVPTGTEEEWSRVFLMIGIIVFVSSIIFLKLSTAAVPALWAQLRRVSVENIEIQ